MSPPKPLAGASLWCVMPRYFLHLDESSRWSSDNEGVECADLEEALELAEYAAELRHRNPAAKLFARDILICDEAGNEVKRIPVIPGQGMLQ
jgi:hypothetical protein